MFSAPAYQGPRSDHFDGKKFFNAGAEEKGFRDFLRWALHRETGPWREFTHVEPAPPPPRRVDQGTLRVTFVNHASMLIQVDGINILTDPVWSHRVSPVKFTGPVRHKPPGIRFEDLPPIDAVLLSHNHYDHLDAPTMTRLAKEHAPKIFTALGNAAYLDTIGAHGAHDMDWWDTALLPGGLELACVPAQHFSGRGTGDRDRTLWCGFMVKSSGGPIYFAADTGVGGHFETIKSRFERLRLAILPIGAYRPRWFMSPVHMGPDDAARIHKLLDPVMSMAIHFGTFALADDGEDEPVDLLNATLDELGIPRENFWAPRNGESIEIPSAKEGKAA
jgi:L-ascorbate metabolism protein UlaG (beta-lactamase superfamily)